MHFCIYQYLNVVRERSPGLVFHDTETDPEMNLPSSYWTFNDGRLRTLPVTDLIQIVMGELHQWAKERCDKIPQGRTVWHLVFNKGGNKNVILRYYNRIALCDFQQVSVGSCKIPKCPWI